MQLSIVMPVYNEGDIIGETLKQVESTVKIPHELLIVYDMDDDTTITPVKNFQKKYPSIKLVKNIYGRGALNALKTGLKKAQGDAVCVMMADLTDDPKVLNEMMAKFEKGFDVVAASRYMKGGHQIGGPLIKQILSRVAGISLHYVVGLPTHDATNSFRLYSRKFLLNMEVESDGGFELAIELTVKAHFGGYKVGEVPTTWTYLAKESRFYLAKWLPKYLKWYLWAIVKRLKGLPNK
ncbi:glycosyl transferase family 2 [Candidatus Curtissbacteria bacterium RIFOXYB1_FULL_41_59]|uniref:Glycosyl transferase family 2 n=1 Tax=Candidatus Curtissbacteria bacterium RIFOXYA1_FULL_41_14 TaxID=1797737 RepID=A0A1F5HAU1_9BACT|nr:MAG: glycosyl transferase family 2 [Candidatus Curtissbacteria bacterium RIFCSPHIGHO2_01_FULL_34_40]OGE01273.1 MAG: glycosyl transferase family 2 [Candidatus Curtissbacteria bacterium RIFOXYA1_FULL_41_14]OGE04182.1 MAG: glycosyl transferase family 2 [Candidatus Curtissbacteria bacterium RIFOXYB1_FULL_41_59]OGE06904.1 MAG: glycosyl transferase family 2 [Candidatus Curtissbacteria bacterium RIFOXYD1_FULL_41_36]OGE09330.1 MAG: glycosyl transferase family 2 [Candidatus Curtissbacteria bacterium 